MSLKDCFNVLRRAYRKGIKVVVNRIPIRIKHWLRQIINQLNVLFNRRRRKAFIKTYAMQRVLNFPVLFTDRFGLQYLLYPTDNVYDRFYHNGHNEVAEQDFCVEYLRPGMMVFDIGANCGIYTSLFCKLVGDNNVHAFEPESWVYYRLKCNLFINNFHNAHVHKVAVFSHSLSEVILHVFPREEFGWHTLGNPKMEVSGRLILPAAEEKVPATSLDDYCASHNIHRVDMLKIDVEGAELDVLRGCERLLSEGKVQSILFEVSRPMVEGMGHNPKDIFDYLNSYGYTIYEICERGILTQVHTAPNAYYQNFVALKK